MKKQTNKKKNINKKQVAKGEECGCLKCILFFSLGLVRGHRRRDYNECMCNVHIHVCSSCICCYVNTVGSTVYFEPS